jgi:hypothetical protein
MNTTITTTLIHAAALVAISQAIISGFNPFHILWTSIQNVKINNEPRKQRTPLPVFLVPLVCGPCFSFWSTLIMVRLYPTGMGILTDIGIASISYIASKVIHRLIK